MDESSRAEFPIALALLLCLLLAPALRADDEGPATEGDLSTRSLPLRTALHHDPTLAAPLDRLLELYRQGGHVDDLVAMYRSHVAQYPQDISARIVLIRLLAANGDPEAGRLARGAVEANPEDPYLRYLLYLSLRSAHDSHALAELDRAIEHEISPERRAAWIDILLPDAVAAGRRDLAEKHLRALGGLAGLTPEARLEAARRMIQFGFGTPALEVLDAAAAAAPAPETGVEIDLAAAAAEVLLDRADAAAARLDRLLGRLTADYWRRSEIVRRRIALVRTDAERDARVQSARALADAHPADESAALDLAQGLAGFERRREALDALLAAGRRIPASARIEKETLELFDRLRDERGREQYLTARAREFPERADLARLRARTLYFLGRRTEARAAFDQVLAGLGESSRPAALLDLARELRRASYTAHAADLFRRATELAPARLELRRELAETLLALGEKGRVRELYSGPLPEDAPADVVLDTARFLTSQDLLVPARIAVASLVRRDAANLDAHLQLIEIAGRLGGRAEGEAEVLRARTLADTGPRYQLWIETCAAFHDRFQLTEEFLGAEQKRLAEETAGWTPAQVDRRLAFTEIAARLGRRAEAAAMLAADLEGELPPEARVSLRRRLMAMLEEDASQVEAVAGHLDALTQEDPQRADEYRARLALVRLKEGRADLALPLLAKVRVAAVLDPIVLGGLENAARANGNRRRVIEILERLTAVDPTGRAGWERRLTALALEGDEGELRAVLRRLLAGIDGLALGDECAALLRDHLADSCWRSIAAAIGDGRAAPMADALALVDETERTAQETDQVLWAIWARALLLQRLGRPKERDEAVAELERIAVEAFAAPDGAEPGPRPEPTIPFPDGLSVSLPRARALLISPRTPAAGAGAGDRRGPVVEPTLRWAFEANHDTPITRIAPCGPDGVLLVDAEGTLYFLDAKTGKLRWATEGALPPTAPAREGAPATCPNAPVSDGEGRILLAGGGKVEALSEQDGRLLWRYEFNAGAAATAAVYLHRGDVLACDPVSGAVGRIDRCTGKLLREIPGVAPAGEPPGFLVSGSDLAGDRLFLFGPRSAILRADTLETEWRFDPARVRAFPVDLAEPGATPSPAPGSPSARGRAGRSVVITTVHSLSGRSFRQVMRLPAANANAAAAIPFDHRARTAHPGFPADPASRISLTASVVTWAADPGGQARRGLIVGERLVLLDTTRLIVLPLDLPLDGMEIATFGAFLGVSGNVVCLLQADKLALVDVVTGDRTDVELSAIGASQPNCFLQGVVDGAVVWVAGPGGILCVNTATGEPCAQWEWPAAAAAMHPGAGVPGLSYVLHGVLAGDDQGNSRWQPMATCAADGVLYVIVAPGRVLALDGGAPR